MAELQRRGAVFVLTLGDDENRFHPDRLTQINAALDEVEAADGPKAPKAIVTTGLGKFYSNGLDLDFMAANPGSAEANLSDVHALFARVLAFPAPIVA
ncbi:MAG: enoyl-CoA hydratase/isomerase family protein, partial [Actinomycetota bacterium]|nr:enoyl-CoA hydratase/isomerase family protein [Actinomycetota bacterium]